MDGQSSGRNTSGVQLDVTAGGLLVCATCSCAVQRAAQHNETWTGGGARRTLEMTVRAAELLIEAEG